MGLCGTDRTWLVSVFAVLILAGSGLDGAGTAFLLYGWMGTGWCPTRVSAAIWAALVALSGCRALWTGGLI